MPSENIPISQLTEATEVLDSDFLAIDNGTTTKKISVENFNATGTASAQAAAEAAAASATAASESATAALGYKNTVQSALNDASTIVSNAQTYANSAESSKNDASGYASAASTSASQAATSASQAASYATGVQEYATEAKSWAQGGTGTRVDEETTNCAYYANAAHTSEINAASSESNAATSETNAATSERNAAASQSSVETNALKAEGYAVGTQNGTAAESGEPYYQDNAKYYKEQAASSETNAAASETNAGLSEAAAAASASAAESSEEDSEAWAWGKVDGVDVPATHPAYHNNAKYWADAASGAAGGGVTSFNGRSGIVSPASGDYDASMVSYNGSISTANQVADAIDTVMSAVEDLASNLPFVTPEDYGAKGDGTTDDTAAFTAAFAASSYVKCMPNKSYNFTGTVDASAISMGILDINNSNLKGFHIKICMANDYQPTEGYPRPMFIIRNGRLNYQVEGKPINWDIPVIISGARMLIENIHCWNTPYLMAVTNSFRDALTIRNISNYMDMSTSRWTGTTFDLDAISLIKSDGSFVRINNNDIKTSVTPSVAGGFGGDAWIFEEILEFRGIENSDYAFIHFNTNTVLRITNCIQTKFVIGQYCQAVFESCHFEDAYTLPEIYNLSDATTHTTTWNDKLVTFRNCYFWDKYAFETDKRYVEYYDCYIRGGASAQDPTIPLATLFKDVDLYDIKCKLHALHVGQTSIVDTDELEFNRKLPKKTRNSNNNTSNEQTMAAKISATKTLASGSNTYPATGTYHYVGYTFTNGYVASNGDKIAHEKYEWERVINNVKSENDNAQLRGLSGGWSFEIYRTLPDGTTIQRARFYSDPFDRNVTEQMYFNINNKGNYLEIRSGYGSNVGNEISYAIPWITVTSIPNYTVNAQVYEKNGVLVTLDNSVIPNLTNQAYAQVDKDFSIPSWSALTGKPFSSIGSGLSVSSDTLSADVQSVTVDSTGTASSSAVSYQRVGVNGNYTEINGTKYMETTTYTTSGDNRVFTFTNVSQDAVIDGPYCDKIGVAPTAQTHSGTTYTVSFATSDAVTKVRIYLK